MKIKASSGEMPFCIHYIAPVGLFVIIFSIMGFWLLNANQPLIDEPFRQSQTAISALWFNLESPIQGLLDYETPELGPPWKIPMEFPLYQAVVAYFSRATGLPITASGRIVGGIFFLITIIPFYMLCSGLGFGKRFFYSSAVLLVGSPLYIFYSRMFLIESTAVFLGFVFLAFLEKALSKRNSILWVCAGIAAILCGLVKVTTFPSFGVAAIGIVFLKNPITSPLNWKSFKKSTFFPLAKLAILGAIVVAIVAFWTYRADAIKLGGELSRFLTSSNLSSWNYGSLEQKLDWRLWRELLFGRVIKLVFGWGVVFGFFLAVSTLLRGKQILIFFWFIGLFIIPMLLFTNLHYVHPHYQTANAFWLVFAFSLGLTAWSYKVDWRIFAMAITLIFICQLYSFYRGDYSRIKLYQNDSLSAGLFIQENSSLEDSLLVFGDDWSPEVSYYAERKAHYIPAWAPDKVAGQIFDRVGIEQSEWPIKVIVHRTGGYWAGLYSESLNQKFHQLLGRLQGRVVKTKIGEYDIFLLKTTSGNMN